MKRIYRIKDELGGYIEVQLLNRNNEVAEDLIWLHVKNGKTKEENGISMKPEEARVIIHGLFLAIDEIIEQYKLERFEIKKG